MQRILTLLGALLIAVLPSSCVTGEGQLLRVSEIQELSDRVASRALRWNEDLDEFFDDSTMNANVVTANWQIQSASGEIPVETAASYVIPLTAVHDTLADALWQGHPDESMLLLYKGEAWSINFAVGVQAPAPVGGDAD